MRLVGKSSSSRMPVVTPKLSLRTASATTTSSSEAFPARSPMPLIVHSICRTPARIAASEFATAMPTSSWQCALRVIPYVSPKYPRTWVNIAPCARERRNRHVATFLRHFLDRLQVSSRRDRKTCFNHVPIQGGKLPRQANLLRCVHRETRRLLAVTERGVKNAYDVHRVPQALVTHTSYPAVQFIFVLHLIISSYTSAGRICLGPRRIAGIPHGRERRQLFPRWRAPLPYPARHQPRYPQTRGLSWPASLRSWRAPCPPHRCGNPSEALRQPPDYPPLSRQKITLRT